MRIYDVLVLMQGVRSSGCLSAIVAVRSSCQDRVALRGTDTPALPCNDRADRVPRCGRSARPRKIAGRDLGPSSVVRRSLLHNCYMVATSVDRFCGLVTACIRSLTRGEHCLSARSMASWVR